jgi:hypothetical protein
VIAILAVVASFVVGYFSTQSGQFYYASCSNAAALCRDTLLIDSNNGCAMCNNACNLSNGTEIFTNATNCCRLGMPSEIYGGSLATDCVSAPPVTPPPGPVCLESDGATVVPEGSCANTKLGRRCVGGSLQPSCSSGCLCNSSIYQKCDTASNYCYNISFTETNISTVSASVKSIAFGDANNDGSNDIVVGLSYADFAVHNTTVMYTYSSGTWIRNNISDKIGNVNSVAIGDADNLQGNEVVVGAGSGKSVVLYNYTGGTWKETVLATTLRASSVAIGDADNVQGNEIVVGFSSDTSPEIRIYNYTAANGWTPTTVKSLPVSVDSIAIGDADNDGANEIVAGLNTTTNEIRMYKYSAGSWIETNISDAPNTAWSGVWAIAIGDANNMNGNDIVAGMGNMTNSTRAYTLSTGVWQEANLSHPNFPDVVSSASGGSGIVLVNSVSIGDIDKDGKNEVIVAYMVTGTGVKIYWYNPIVGQWPRTALNYPGLGFPHTAPHATAIGDLNNDGTNDIILGLEYSSQSQFELRSYAAYRIYDY